jgi:hypothetical protein
MAGRNANFYDLTFLYPNYDDNFVIDYSDEKEYHNRIRNYLIDHPEQFRDGDIIFIGSTHERQQYGFATVINNGTNFQGGEYPRMNTPGVYYKNTIEEIDSFWENFEGVPYFNNETEDYELLVEELKNTRNYQRTPKQMWKNLLPKAKEASKIRKRNEKILGEYFPYNVADKISRYSVFGKKRRSKVDSELVYLQKIISPR